MDIEEMLENEKTAPVKSSTEYIIDDIKKDYTEKK